MLRYVVDLSIPEIAKVLNIALQTAYRDWASARALLKGGVQFRKKLANRWSDLAFAFALLLGQPCFENPNEGSGSKPWVVSRVQRNYPGVKISPKIIICALARRSRCGIYFGTEEMGAVGIQICCRCRS